MKRRSFIAYSSLTAIGVLVCQSGILATAKPIANAVQLPEALSHVRHGNYGLKAIKNHFLPKWIKVFEPHRFLENGFESTENDLQLFQFDLENQSLVLGYNNESISLISEGFQKEISLHNSDQKLRFETDTYQVSVINKLESLAIETKQEHVLFVLKGKVSVNNKRLVERDFVHFKNENINVELSENTLVILVSKTV
jgi:hypothetical protein